MPIPTIPLITMIERNSNDIDEIYDLLKHVDAHLDDHDARFDAVDKRFDEVDKRFDEVDKRFDAVDARLDAQGVQLTEILSILRPGEPA